MTMYAPSGAAVTVEDILTGVVHGHDVGIVQGGGGLASRRKLALEGRVDSEIGAKHFHRDSSVEPLVATLEDLGRTAASPGLAQLVAITQPSNCCHANLPGRRIHRWHRLDHRTSNRRGDGVATFTSGCPAFLHCHRHGDLRISVALPP